jgi:hypothetical protein
VAAKAANEKVKAIAVITTTATETMTAAMAHGRTGEVTDTTTGEAMALPGTVEDVMTAGAPEIPGDRHRPTHGTAIVLSRK